MAKEKTTVTIDRAKVAAVQKLTGASSTSAAIDVALAEVLRADRIRRDVAAYADASPTDDERRWSHAPRSNAGIADDTDWAALYNDEQGDDDGT